MIRYIYNAAELRRCWCECVTCHNSWLGVSRANLAESYLGWSNQSWQNSVPAYPPRMFLLERSHKCAQYNKSPVNLYWYIFVLFSYYASSFSFCWFSFTGMEKWSLTSAHWLTSWAVYRKFRPSQDNKDKTMDFGDQYDTLPPCLVFWGKQQCLKLQGRTFISWDVGAWSCTWSWRLKHGHQWPERVWRNNILP